MVKDLSKNTFSLYTFEILSYQMNQTACHINLSTTYIRKKMGIGFSD
jgi:hypothetical protein